MHVLHQALGTCGQLLQFGDQRQTADTVRYVTEVNGRLESPLCSLW